MPRGDKSSYTDKQKRQAEHIEDSYESRGVSHKEADIRAVKPRLTDRPQNDHGPQRKRREHARATPHKLG
jgi:hypothetical protein